MNNIGAKYFRSDIEQSALQDSIIRILSYDDFDRLYKAIDKDGKSIKRL